MLPVISPRYNLFLCHYSFSSTSRLVVTFILETWIHMPVGSHYFSWWYWYSIITYAYRHYFSGAINMCCDLGALDLNLTHMFITGWSMFQKCHLCIFPNRFGVTPILDSPTKDKENFFFSFFFWNSTAHWPSFFFLRMVASDLADWKVAAMEGTAFLRCAFWWRSMGLPLKTCHFLYFCSLSPDTHEMQWSLQFVLMFFLFSKCRQNEI